MSTLKDLQDYFSKEVPAEAPEGVRDMLNDKYRFDSYYLLLCSIEDLSLGPDIPLNGVHYYSGILAREGFFKIHADDSGRFVYDPTDKAKKLVKMASTDKAMALVV